MQVKLKKKVGSLLLVLAMIITSLPILSHEVQAADNELPNNTQFATVEELKSFNTNENDSTTNPAKVYFGQNNQQWWIAGSQNDDSMTLFAASPLATDESFSLDQNVKPYDKDWNCTYPEGVTITEVNPDHYGASNIRARLKSLETSYFSNEEQKLMKDTTIYTDDTKNGVVYSTTDKLYLGYGDTNSHYMTVGANTSDNLNNGLHIDNTYCNKGGSSFTGSLLRRGRGLLLPGSSSAFWVLIMNTGGITSNATVTSLTSIYPAFELNLSSVLFASAASAASNGQLQTNDTFTLRYSGKDLGSAQVSYDKSKVNLSNVPSDTYLVVQNSNGAYAQEVSGTTSVSAKDMGLDNFENCKVWLETTDTTNRMTYATLATEEQGYQVNITGNDGLTVTNGNQSVAQGKEISDITVEVDSEYYLSDDYINNLESQLNGLTVTKTDKGFTIKGTPTSDVNITLPPATKKVYSTTLDGNGTFGTTCIDYEPITSNEFIITNNGNVDLENVNVSITGNDADKFELVKNSTTIIQPNGTITVTVKPNDSLSVGTYQATLSVSADNANTVTTDLQFTVSEHDYNAVATPPTCTEKGYTTYTCKNCPHSYVGDEVNANGHTWGEWVVIDSPTCEQGGIRKHTCLVCNTEETENLNPNEHEWETKYTVDKAPTCTQDGSKSIHCKNCAATKDSETIPRLEHSFTNYVSNNDATCTKDGTKTAKCDRCDETDTIVDTGSMLEHEYEWKYNNDATCTENGTETGTCKHCQAEMTREKADSALGHEFKNYVSDDNATCTENGTETAKCERCDKTDARTEENSVLGHKLTEWKIIKKATTTTTGMKERTCERCDYKETEVLPMVSDDNNTPNQDKPNTDKDNVKTGDQTNVGLFTSLLTMSGLLITILAVLKKKKA